MLGRCASISVVVLAVVATSACAESTDGARRKVCGTWLGAPADGVDKSPWFVDATGVAPPARIVGYVDTSRFHIPLMFVNMLVSDDCSHGARVTIDGSHAISIQTEVTAKDHRDVVTLIQARRVGHTTLTVTRTGEAPTRIAFVIRKTDSQSP
jgi:hypothetical protein